MKSSCYGYVFARGGSKGVLRKNIRLLQGKPLIAYSIETLKQCRYVDRVIVSTEDEEIARIAQECGAEVPFMRPAELAQDNSPELLAWQHVLQEAAKEGEVPKIFISAPATSPFRISEDIDRAVEELLNSQADLVIGVTPAAKNPYFHMVSMDDRGGIHPLLSLDKPITRRQDAPVCYEIAPVVYAAFSDYILNCKNLMGGHVRGIQIPPDRAVDIDTELDFQFAEFQMSPKSVRIHGE